MNEPGRKRLALTIRGDCTMKRRRSIQRIDSFPMECSEPDQRRAAGPRTSSRNSGLPALEIQNP
jgi:hypothetical protein